MESEDKIYDHCGVVGIYSPTAPAIGELLYYGLYALQHRGQESTGIAVFNGNTMLQHKKQGLVSEVFTDEALAKLNGIAGIGHVRYSTTGENKPENVQPLVVKYRAGSIALCHNGNLVNATALRQILEDEGVVFQTTVDTEVMVNLLARYQKDGIVNAIRKLMEVVKGAYALVIISEGKLIGVRDFYGFRPLCIGKRGDAYLLASETCALDTIGAEFVRDVEPGEIVIIDENGLQSFKSDKWSRKHLCMFELIYFSRPDSFLDGINAHSYRYKTGKILAQESPIEADRVIAVPDSGTSAAIGFAEESGIPFGIGLIKNRYIGRTFIQPNQKLREQGVRIKLNVLTKNVVGKRIVIVDDSIVRGTTIKHIIEMCRKAGAIEVHLRISSPPVTHSCFFGIDTPTRSQLIGAQHTVEEIRQILGADTLAYISDAGMIAATKQKKGFCTACFDGDYPMEVPLNGDNLKKE